MFTFLLTSFVENCYNVCMLIEVNHCGRTIQQWVTETQERELAVESFQPGF